MIRSWIKTKVRRKTQPTPDIVVLELVDPDGRDLPTFSAGAHVDVEVRPGCIRQYSLCNNCSERDRYVIAVLKERESRGGSIHLHEAVAEEDVLLTSEPKNHFPLSHDARRHLLFAGGIGITPLLCMAERLARTGQDFDLHYCARSRDRAAFLDRLADPLFAGRVHLHFDDGAPEQKLDLASALGPRGEGLHAYVCGPAGFIDWILKAARDQGWPDAALHREYFAAPAEDARSGGTAFRVRLAGSGNVYEIPPGRSVAQVLMDAGVELTVSCEEGVCGTCLTRVLEGTPDHRDVYLTEEEKQRNDQFTPCISRSLSRELVLDV